MIFGALALGDLDRSFEETKLERATAIAAIRFRFETGLTILNLDFSGDLPDVRGGASNHINRELQRLAFETAECELSSKAIVVDSGAPGSNSPRPKKPAVRSPCVHS